MACHIDVKKAAEKTKELQKKTGKSDELLCTIDSAWCGGRRYDKVGINTEYRFQNGSFGEVLVEMGRGKTNLLGSTSRLEAAERGPNGPLLVCRRQLPSDHLLWEKDRR